jgi:hypothetical protein
MLGKGRMNTTNEMQFAAAEETKSTRRSDRFPSVVPVEARWQAGGETIVELGNAVEVNAHGGILRLHRYPENGVVFEITNRMSGEAAKARVIGMRSEAGLQRGAAIELAWPSDTFWGLSYRLQRTSAELLRLDEVLREGTMDLRVLRDFRDAVDYVRKTSWAVYEWHERQQRQRDTATVLPLLTRERIRRAAKLCNDIAADLRDGRMQEYINEVTDLRTAIRNLETLFATASNASEETAT